MRSKKNAKAWLEKMNRVMKTCSACGKFDENTKWNQASGDKSAAPFCPPCDPQQIYNKFYARIRPADPMEEYHWAEYVESIYGFDD